MSQTGNQPSISSQEIVIPGKTAAGLGIQVRETGVVNRGSRRIKIRRSRCWMSLISIYLGCLDTSDHMN